MEAKIFLTTEHTDYTRSKIHIMKKHDLTILSTLSAILWLGSGCQVLTYRGPNGERFTRSSLGARTSLASLSVEAGTNGIRKVELRGYTNDSTQALGAVTEAAVRAAIQGVK